MFFFFIKLLNSSVYVALLNGKNYFKVLVRMTKVCICIYGVIIIVSSKNKNTLLSIIIYNFICGGAGEGVGRTTKNICYC